jgi:hypothetical protein
LTSVFYKKRTHMLRVDTHGSRIEALAKAKAKATARSIILLRSEMRPTRRIIATSKESSLAWLSMVVRTAEPSPKKPLDGCVSLVENKALASMKVTVEARANLIRLSIGSLCQPLF